MGRLIDASEVVQILGGEGDLEGFWNFVLDKVPTVPAVPLELFTEAMELLGLAVGKFTQLADSVLEHCDNIEPCYECEFSPENTEASDKECPGYDVDKCFRWQHADRYEKLKAEMEGLK